MLKDFDSKWEPSDRSAKWLKLKPDYIHSESDLDAIIIGEHMLKQILDSMQHIAIFGALRER